MRLPAESEWIDRGIVLRPGGAGAWDERLAGSTPSSVVRIRETYFLYYVGAAGDRSTDGGPRNRALGVATSPDGIEFTKHPGNPILTFQPHQNEEEGIWSAAAVVDGGEVLLYYGAIVEADGPAGLVNANVRYAVSSDGLDFVDQGVVLEHGDPGVWGYGDELAPTGAFRAADGSWNLYYISKGVATFWDLGLASGSARGQLSETGPALDLPVQLRFGGDPVYISPGELALPHTLATGEMLMLRVAVDRADRPAEAARYRFDTHAVAVHLDREGSRWLLYHGQPLDDDLDAVRVKTAPLRFE